MSKKEKGHFNTIKTNRIILPILIGVAVVAYLLINEFDKNAFNEISFSSNSYLWIFVAVLLMLGRDIGYMIRLKILSDNAYTWLQTFRIIMLWEFSSAITPSAIGGTGFAIIYLHKEGLSVGKSTSIALATSFLDEMYSIVFFPLMLLIINPYQLFIINNNAANSAIPYLNEFFYFAVIGYTFKLMWVSAIGYGLFINPRGFKWLLLKIFKLPLIKKWRSTAHKTGDEIIQSSIELKRKTFYFWLKAAAATFLSWTSRYWVVNAMFLAFFVVKDHFLIYARQLVMWIMMIVSPTPGGSGFAEIIFKEYLSEFIEVNPALYLSVGIAMALIWRLISYYPYLFIGVIIFPKWIKAKFGKKKDISLTTD